MNHHLKIVGSLCLLGALAMLAYKGYELWQHEHQQRTTTDAVNTKGTITLARDGWVGYFPLCSQIMASRLRHQGYLLRCIDDQADYEQRFRLLARGDYTFAVATVDSYLQNAEATAYATPVIAVIDESKGGDAIIADASKVSRIEDLKDIDEIKVAFTPNSPSEHLLRAVRSHFDILPQKWLNRWRVETNGSVEALAKLNKGEVDIAVLWEPEVTRAMVAQNRVQLLSTEDTQNLIVDILVANAEVLQGQPELVATFLKTYFETLQYYRTHEDELIAELGDNLDLAPAKTELLLQGVEWKTLTDNAEHWFGTGASDNRQQYLFDTINATLQLLQEDDVFKRNPIPNQDPNRLLSSSLITELYNSMASGELSRSAVQGDDAFPPLSEQAWQRLTEVGTFRVRPITFSSGTSEITEKGRQQIDLLVQNLQHYPNFRVEIRGHTGTRGDPEANKQLSLARALAVYQHVTSQYPVDKDRFNARGFGGERPLQRLANESNRSYNYRLPRVEIVLMRGEL